MLFEYQMFTMHYHRLEHKMFGQSLGGFDMSEYDRSPCIQCDTLYICTNARTISGIFLPLC